MSDRVITVTGLSLTAIPEFVTAIVLILIFGLWLAVAAGQRHRPAGRQPRRPRCSTCCSRASRS